MNTFGRVVFFGVAIMGVGLDVAAPAEIYTWTGPDGRTHFGDRPPHEGAEPIELRQPDAPAAAADANERRRAQQKLLEVYRQEREEKTAAEQKARAEKAERAEQCNRARSQLARYQDSNALYRRSEDGKQEALSFEERDRLTAQARERVSRLCGGY